MGEPIRVLIVIGSLGPGGAERLVLDQLRAGDRSEFSYQLFVARARAPDLLDTALETGLPVHRGYDSERPWPLVLRSLLRRMTFDVVHSHLPLAAVGTRLVAKLLPTGGRRPALVYTEHNRWPSHRLPTRWLNRATIRLDDLILAVSQDAADSIGWPARRPVVVIQHGVAPLAARRTEGARRRLRQELGLPAQATILGTVANLRREKDQANLLHGFAQAELDPDVTLAIVGQGPLEADLHELAARLGLGERVRFLGYRSDAVEVMSGFDLFTLPSLHEGRPLALMEAMALGLPVVVTPVGGMADMIEDGRSGLVVPASEPSALARAFERVTGDAELRAELSAGAAEASRDQGGQAAFEAIEAHYRTLVGAAAEPR